MDWIGLYCIVLYCIVLYYIVFSSTFFYSLFLYSTLFSSLLFSSILFYSILYYTILFYSILFYSILFYSILFYSNLIYSLFSFRLYCTLDPSHMILGKNRSSNKWRQIFIIWESSRCKLIITWPAIDAFCLSCEIEASLIKTTLSIRNWFWAVTLLSFFSSSIWSIDWDVARYNLIPLLPLWFFFTHIPHGWQKMCNNLCVNCKRGWSLSLILASNDFRTIVPALIHGAACKTSEIYTENERWTETVAHVATNTNPT